MIGKALKTDHVTGRVYLISKIYLRLEELESLLAHFCNVKSMRRMNLDVNAFSLDEIEMIEIPQRNTIYVMDSLQSMFKVIYKKQTHYY